MLSALITGSEGVNTIWVKLRDLINSDNTLQGNIDTLADDLAKQLLDASDYTESRVSTLKAIISSIDGNFYGFYPSSTNLPTGSVAGYAYVATANANEYTIWNYIGTTLQWINSGMTKVTSDSITPLIVNLTNTSGVYSADKTSAEIISAFDSKSVIVFKYVDGTTVTKWIVSTSESSDGKIVAYNNSSILTYKLGTISFTDVDATDTSLRKNFSFNGDGVADSNGQAVVKYANDGVHVSNVVFEKDTETTSINKESVDKLINNTDAINKEKERAESTEQEIKSSLNTETQNRKSFESNFNEVASGIADSNGYAAFKIDEKGNILVPLKIFNNGKEFGIADSNGYAAFKIDEKGKAFINQDLNFLLNVLGRSYKAINNTISIPTDNIRDLKVGIPKRINVVQDTLMYLYFENVISKGWEKYYHAYIYDYDIPKDYTLISYKDVGERSLPIYFADGYGNLICEKDVTINVIDKAVKGTFNVLVIGDSKTENVTKLAELLNLCEKDGSLNINLLGTRNGTAEDSDGNTRIVKHEGYSGRTVINVCKDATLNGVENVFYNESLTDDYKFDFAKGVDKIGSVPDIVFIDHGANQWVSSYSEVKASYDSIIASINNYNTSNNAKVKVVICLQEGFSLRESLTNTSQGKWYLMHTSTNRNKILEDFEDREDEGIFIQPQYLDIDLYNDFPMAKVPINHRNGLLKEVVIDGVHPGINLNHYDVSKVYNYGDTFVYIDNGVMKPFVVLKQGISGITPIDDKVNYAQCEMEGLNAGYYKIADCYYTTLKYIASLNI